MSETGSVTVKKKVFVRLRSDSELSVLFKDFEG